nr:PREDICTED: band 4.1-like protein 4A [Bemisia tabaci]
MRCLCTKSQTHHCKVVLLDEQELLHEIQDNTRGQELVDLVFRHLNLLETAYFGLRYIDANNQTHWLDNAKRVVKQLRGKDTLTLYFGVKFYAVDPCKLLEEITRYQFFLQVKQDILQGRLPVTPELAAELGAYVVQSELGDYDPRRHSPGYVSEFRFVANQTAELETKIAQIHKELVGQLPCEAELNYLDKVKWLEMYGVDLHPVLGDDNVEYFLGLTPTGVIVLRNKNKVANYYWTRISKIYSKGKYFMLRVCDKNNEENTYGFETPSRAACKHLYKCSAEHHSFFRLVQVLPNPPDILTSRFSSRTEKLSGRSLQLSLRNPPNFVRTPSRRYQRRIVEGALDPSKAEDPPPPTPKENVPPAEVKTVSIPQPVYSVRRSDSPRSTRSAPWGPRGSPQSVRAGLFSGSSPRSVRSAGPHRRHHHRRSSSVESHSSNDSHSCRRRRHRSRRGSDCESELSRCSGKSHHSHRRPRHRSRKTSHSDRESSKHSNYQLVESESQWKEVQRRRGEGSESLATASVSRPRSSGHHNSGMETESERSYHHHHRRKHRKHRSRSPSSDKSSRLPDELKQHLEFSLVETEGMSESQLKEIPYKVVETNTAKSALRVRLSPSNKRKLAPRRTKSNNSLKDGPPSNSDSPPPPYSESPVLSDLNKNNSKSNSQLPRIPARSQPSRPPCSALYGNPGTLLGRTPFLHGSQNSVDLLDHSAWNSTPKRSDHSPQSSPYNSIGLPLPNQQKIWSSPEVRGTVGLPWPSIMEGFYQPGAKSMSNGYYPSNLYNNQQLGEPMSANQNILEHGLRNVQRPSDTSMQRSSSINSGLNKQKEGLPSSLSNHSGRFTRGCAVETGVLGSHTITPNGSIAWPNSNNSMRGKLREKPELRERQEPRNVNRSPALAQRLNSSGNVNHPPPVPSPESKQYVTNSFSADLLNWNYPSPNQPTAKMFGAESDSTNANSWNYPNLSNHTNSGPERKEFSKPDFVNANGWAPKPDAVNGWSYALDNQWSEADSNLNTKLTNGSLEDLLSRSSPNGSLKRWDQRSPSTSMKGKNISPNSSLPMHPNGWQRNSNKAGDRGPLYLSAQAYENENENGNNESKTSLQNSEVNNNGRIIDEMSTEL